MNPRSFLAVVGCAAWLGACSDGSDVGALVPEGMPVDAGDAPPDAEGPDSGGSRSGQRVIGRYSLWYSTGWEDVEVGADMRANPPVVWIPRSDGGFDRREGLGGNRGDFEIGDVTGGPFWLELLGDFILGWPGERFDLRNPGLGFFDQQTGTPGTRLDVSLTGLEPWQADDDLYLFSAQTGTQLLARRMLDRPPRPADTEIQATIELPGEPLVQGRSRGDELYVVQMQHTRVGDAEVLTAGRALKTSDVQMVAGASAPLTGALEPAAALTRKTLAWNPRSLLLRANEGVPLLVPQGATLSLTAAPGAAALFARAGALLGVAWGAHDSVPGAFEYADPYPATWRRTVRYDVRFKSYVPVDSSGRTCDYTGSIGGAAYTSREPIELPPIVGPPRNVQVEGEPSDGVVLRAGLSPRVTWQAPDGVPANGYLLRVYTSQKPVNQDCSAVGGPRLFTAYQDVRLPPGLVQPGHWTFVVVRAIADTAQDDSPYFTGNWSSYAEAVSTVFLP
jgi:hypothetical protein